MTPEVLSIIGVGIVLAGIILTGQRNLRAELRADYHTLRAEMERRFERVEERLSALQRGQARLDGLLDGLREAISGRRAAADD